MSTVNMHFTFNYVQPDEYRFSHDSVFLARQAFELVQTEKPALQNVLDLGAGCGIVGLDFLHHLHTENIPLPQTVDFLEVQPVYETYFAENLQAFKTAVPDATPPDCHFILDNYSTFSAERFQKYDLILCNPPYFRKEHGLPAATDFKNRCRFFIDSDFATLVKALDHALAPKGRALILLRSLAPHGISVEAEFKAAAPMLDLQPKGHVRSTHLYLVTRIHSAAV